MSLASQKKDPKNFWVKDAELLNSFHFQCAAKLNEKVKYRKKELHTTWKKLGQNECEKNWHRILCKSTNICWTYPQQQYLFVTFSFCLEFCINTIYLIFVRFFFSLISLEALICKTLKTIFTKLFFTNYSYLFCLCFF